MEEQLKKQKNIRFSGASASHKNGAEERNTKMVFILAGIMLMYYVMRFYKDKLYTYFGEWKWTILYGYTVG